MHQRLNKELNKLAAISWISSLQFFAIQILVASSFKPDYSIKANTISDLGNTVCGPYGDRLVCSPDYIWMNLSLAVLSFTMITGSVLFLRLSMRTKLELIGFSMMALSGVGSLLVGIFPENSISTLHLLGAGLSFTFGNLAVILIALTHPNRTFKVISVIAGSSALVLLLFLITNNYLGLGLGGIERLVAYTQTFWLVSYGIMSLKHKQRNRDRNRNRDRDIR